MSEPPVHETDDDLKLRIERLTEENARLKIERDIALMDLKIINEVVQGGADERATFYRGVDLKSTFDIEAFISELTTDRHE